MSVRDILESFEELTIDEELPDDAYRFTLCGKHFAIWPPNADNAMGHPLIFLLNDDGTDIPHIMLQDLSERKGKQEAFRLVCLYEHESVVFSTLSYEEKIYDAIDRLIELLSMSSKDQEREFQKEFLYYWNSSATSSDRYNAYIADDSKFSRMHLYKGNSSIRLVDEGINLTDIKDRNKYGLVWSEHLEMDVYHIPITDCRGIRPPCRNYKWSAHDIRNIIYASQINHINEEVFNKLAEINPRTQNIILVFSMQTMQSTVTFAAIIKCNNHINNTLLQRLKNDILFVEPVSIHRIDYGYLNKVIGNDNSLRNKRVLLIGAGSLGSYIAFELVKNGASSIKIYDGDNLEEENVLRWVYGGIGKGNSKAETLQVLLNNIHPEITIEAVNKNIDCQTLEEEAQRADLIIFSIGSSDAQLSFNKKLKAIDCTAPVLYVWLEAGGEYSHILVVNYRKAGCFECLFTDDDGAPINNRASLSTTFEDSIIRNGCGGTRAAYGTSILLRTTSALLDTISHLYSNEIQGNTLIDISPEKREISKTKFPQEVCKCCGNQGIQSVRQNETT